MFPTTTATPPAPPNPQVVSPFRKGVWDLKWDDPSVLPTAAGWDILGQNIYRSTGSDRGPYIRVNQYPVSGTFYRDQSEVALVSEEVVDWETGWVVRGDGANNREWTLQTAYPIVQQHNPTAWALSPQDVEVRIRYADGSTDTLPVAAVQGAAQQVTLVDAQIPDALAETLSLLRVPSAESVLTVTYWRPLNTVVRTSLDRKPFYRITTVALDPESPTGLSETPLDQCPPISPIQVETRDYIWTEAARRNNWILEQGGERVKVFIRKVAGVPCWCGYDIQTRTQTKQPSARCSKCFGTGFLGGFEGPYEAILAPDDAERRISQSQYGRRMEHTYEVWCGPSPVVTQRDFIVKQTNERYSIGPVRRPTARGNLVQQHFSISYLADQDVRYEVPIYGTTELAWPQTRYTRELGVKYPVGTAYQATPMETEKEGIPDSREIRGRTPVFENQNY